MIDKTRLGIRIFDDQFGGVYRNRPTLCIGRRGSGKTLLAIQALLQSVHEGERGLMLSAWRAPDLAILAGQYGLPLADAVSAGNAVLLEYGDIMPTPDFEKSLTLPPGSFMEFQEIVQSNGIRRVVIDTVLPWVAIPQENKLAKHVYSFILALERMNVTSLLTLPRPASPLAFSLRNRLEEQIPIVFTLDVDAAGKHTMLVNKYLGYTNLPPPLVLMDPLSEAAAESAAPPASPHRAESKGPIRFSSVFKTRQT